MSSSTVPQVVLVLFESILRPFTALNTLDGSFQAMNGSFIANSSGLMTVLYAKTFGSLIRSPCEDGTIRPAGAKDRHYTGSQASALNIPAGR
jgi:hypothetical protein